MEIQLTQGKSTTIDDVDSEQASLGWSVKRDHQTHYAQRWILRPDGTHTTERLHQAIARKMGIVGIPDHIDRNGLNNRRSNLRPADESQNRANRQGWGKSGFKGVSFHNVTGKWRAQIMVNRKYRYLGLFATAFEAAKAYDKAALEAWGPFAVLNCPIL